jgi:tetratricopeptide (TPR) repeat protein
MYLEYARLLTDAERYDEALMACAQARACTLSELTSIEIHAAAAFALRQRQCVRKAEREYALAYAEAHRWLRAACERDRDEANHYYAALARTCAHHARYLCALPGKQLDVGLAKIDEALAALATIERMHGSGLLADAERGTMHDTKGWLLFHQGKLRDARASLERAQRYNPNNGEIHAHLSWVYARLATSPLAHGMSAHKTFRVLMQQHYHFAVELGVSLSVLPPPSAIQQAEDVLRLLGDRLRRNRATVLATALIRP